MLLGTLLQRRKLKTLTSSVSMDEINIVLFC
jgi:hypothetical protein